MPIKNLYARQIFDSRGFPTIEVDLITDIGLFRASVPSGDSTSSYEALELRDNDKKNYLGKSVFKAVTNVNELIAPELLKSQLEVTEQTEIDELLLKLDGTENKSNLGSNAILSVSLAVCKAGAARRGLPLYKHIADLAGNTNLIIPVPSFNVINGGTQASNKMPFQEFMILPTGANSFAEAMKMGIEVYHNLKDLIAKKKKKAPTIPAVGDEGAFAPNIAKPKAALDLLKKAISKAGYNGRIEIAMDVSASDFYRSGKYNLEFKNPKKSANKSKWLSPEKLFTMYKGFIKKFPVVSIEDPFDQDDWNAWAKINNTADIQVVGDSLTVTNPKRIALAVEKKACNCLLLKVNQIGSVTEAINAHLLAKSNGWGTIVSHLSGETEDTFIADLVVGLSTGQIKAGAPCRSERVAKYNHILRIEEELGSSAKYAGRAFRKPQ